MPFYEYRCESCGHVLEAMQKISAAPLTDCPNCNNPALTKLVSAAGFRLKGGGWYETDFKAGSKKNVAESPTKESAPAKEAAPSKKSSPTKEPKPACASGACSASD